MLLVKRAPFTLHSLALCYSSTAKQLSLGGGGCAHEGRSFYRNTVVLQGTAYELTVIALHMCFHITGEHSHCLVLHTK